ncbi:HepT-like ribonuclease domain-containing protein [Roseateles sp. P5_E4]
MAPDLRKYIWNAKEAAARALRFTAGKSLDDYVGDELLRSAVERQFLILGEALGRVRQLDPNLASRIADHSPVAAKRSRSGSSSGP